MTTHFNHSSKDKAYKNAYFDMLITEQEEDNKETEEIEEPSVLTQHAEEAVAAFITLKKAIEAIADIEEAEEQIEELGGKIKDLEEVIEDLDKVKDFFKSIGLEVSEEDESEESEESEELIPADDAEFNGMGPENEE